MKAAWTVQCRVSGVNAEKLLNEAGKRGITLRRVKREKDRSLRIACSPGTYDMFCALAREKGFDVGPARAVGGYRLMQAAKKRGGLLLGAAACAVLLFFAMQHIWWIRIENAGAYAGEVRAFLQEAGIRPGMEKRRIDLGNLREQLEWRLPRVKWVRTEISGIMLIVRLEEGTAPPNGTDQTAGGDVIAGEDGWLIRLTVYAGTPQAKEGDFVRAGQVLIKGEERGKEETCIPVAARGEAIARTWKIFRVRMPRGAWITVPTGREAERRILRTPLFQWCHQEEAEYLVYDTDRHETTIGGAWIPVILERERRIEAGLEKTERNLEEVKEEGKKAALQMMNQALIGEEVVDKWINFRMIEGDTIEVEAIGEIRRDIGRFRKN